VQDTLSRLKPQHLIFTGHSLGAATAALSLYQVESNLTFSPQTVALYTFGSPKIANPDFCISLDKTYSVFRVMNTADMVPMLPFSVTPNVGMGNQIPWKYATPGSTTQYELNRGSWNNNHFISTYIRALKSPDVVFSTIPPAH
jgi:hypothetical protein